MVTLTNDFKDVKGGLTYAQRFRHLAQPGPDNVVEVEPRSGSPVQSFLDKLENKVTNEVTEAQVNTNDTLKNTFGNSHNNVKPEVENAPSDNTLNNTLKLDTMDNN